MQYHELEIAKMAVVEASRLCKSVQQNLVSDDSLQKRDKSPVTIADFGAQAIVSRILQKHLPDDPIMGEEEVNELRAAENTALQQRVIEQVQRIHADFSAIEILNAIDSANHEGRSKGRFWILDPIDGTKGFLRKEQYAIALALIEDGEIVLGVLGCPNLPMNLNEPASRCGVIFSAVRGQGAAVEDLDRSERNSISVSPILYTSQAVFCESVESGHTDQSESVEIAQILGVQSEPVRMDSQCKYGIVARGDASIYLRLPTSMSYEEKIWDHAAGAIIVQEAGGRVTDIHGKPLDFSQGRTLKNNKGVIATNGILHDEVLKAVERVLDL